MSAPMSDSCRSPTSVAQTGVIRRFDPARDALDESLADRAVLVARQLRAASAPFVCSWSSMSKTCRQRLKRDACTPEPALRAMTNAQIRDESELAGRQALRHWMVHDANALILVNRRRLCSGHGHSGLMPRQSGCARDRAGTRGRCQKSTPRVGRKQFPSTLPLRRQGTGAHVR